MRASDSDKETGGKRKGSSINKKKVLSRDFASGPVAKTLHFHSTTGGIVLTPGWRTKIPHAV